MVGPPVFRRVSPRAPRFRSVGPRRTAAVVAVGLIAVVGSGGTAVASTAHSGGGGAAGRAADPSVSMPPSAAFDRSCFEPNQAVECNAAALADIDLARKAEHLPALVLPKRFASRSTPAQLGIIVNLERKARHLATMAMKRPLDARALAGAEAGLDPTGPADNTWGSNLASGYATPLAADFAWMYDDGVGSSNSACTSSGQPGCWGHRNNILAPWAGAQGAGQHVNGHGAMVLAQLFVKSR